MRSPALPYLVQADVLGQAIQSPDRENLRIICLGQQNRFQAGHIPAAVWLDSAKLNRGLLPAPGLLPEPAMLERVFYEIGLAADEHVVSYDDDGGTQGARLMWVLEAMGHQRQSMLDGGLDAWTAENLPLETRLSSVIPARNPWKPSPDPSVIADKDYVLSKLGDPSVRILDVRSVDEFMGRKTHSARKGHIPGASHLHWLDTIDVKNHHRIKPQYLLEGLLAEKGIHRNQEIIVHCQTHQRSSHSFVMLRSLGFQHVKAYAGSWMEWAADHTMPIIREDITDN